MIQEFIPGHGAGLFCLYNKGKASHFFAHNRLREKPPEGGVSVLSQAAELNPTLKESAVKLLDSVQWHGVAMVEFRIDEQGNAYLMEVNTRFWGSLQLAIDSGVNFPVLLAQQFFNEPTNPKTAFSTKQRLRWLMGDIDSLYIYLKRPYSISEKVGRVFQFLSPKLKNQKHEINRLDDIKPFFYELKHYFK
jgi:predicted ATP-grasp superfamily ATP-dependent carboligase